MSLLRLVIINVLLPLKTAPLRLGRDVQIGQTQRNFIPADRFHLYLLYLLTLALSVA